MEITRSRRRRRQRRPRRTRQTLWCLSGLLIVWGGGANAGRRDVTWSHADHDELGATAMVVDAIGAMVVTGCSSSGESFYVAKFSAHGDQLWRETIRANDVAGADEGDASSTACATAIATDAARNLYVTGTLGRETDSEDTNVFVARLSASGALVWIQTLGTPYGDVATSLCVDALSTSVFVGGYSAGRLAMGRASPHNCDARRNDGGVCDDGFVVRLAADVGAVTWVHAIVSDHGSNTRVFDLVTAVDTNSTASSLVVVGETISNRGSPNANANANAGHVFVHRLMVATGEPLWTKQIDGPTAIAFCQQRLSPPSPSEPQSKNDRVYPRGRCGITVHGAHEISVVGTTLGLLSTVPSQHESYHEVCGAATPLCTQLFVARLDLDAGNVRWVQQLIHAAFTTAERVVALYSTDQEDATSTDVAVLATADAGFFASAEAMKQLAVVRLSGKDGSVLWTAELGLAGDDYAVSLTATTQDSSPSLVVLAHGSTDKARRGQTSMQSWIRRVQQSDGSAAPMCVDVIGFDKSRSALLPPSVPHESPQWRLVQLPLQRDDAMRCTDAAAAVRYHYSVSLNETSSPLSSSSSSGVVHFAASQLTANLALSVQWTATTLHVSLEPFADDTTVNATLMAWTLDLAAVVKERDAVSSVADGRLWQQLTWVALVVAVVTTAVVVVCGRVLCRQSSAWSWRRAKAFQYTTLRLRRTNKETAKTSDTADETQELRSHLEEIQLLNDSLDGLLLTTHAGSSSSSSLVASAVVVPTSPTRTKMNRSLRRLLPSPQKKQ